MFSSICLTNSPLIPKILTVPSVALSKNIVCDDEIAKDAAIIVNPYNKNDITHELWQIEKNKKVIQKIVDLGNKRAHLFNWEKSANQTWNVLKNSI